MKRRVGLPMQIGELDALARQMRDQNMDEYFVWLVKEAARMLRRYRRETKQLVREVEASREPVRANA